MKFTFIMLVLIFAFMGCTPTETTQEKAEPGDERNFQPLSVEHGAAIKNSVMSICAALEEKERVLEDYRNETFSVKYQESDCNGKLSKPVTHEVSLIREGGRFIFQNNNRSFPATEIETMSTGVMKEICMNLIGLKNPLAAGAGLQTAVEFRVGETSYCRNDSQNACIQVMRGRISADGTRYTVSENTLISFQTARGGRMGFYTYKNIKTYGTCGANKFRTKLLTFDF